jgi:hypothetical protein
MAVPMPTNLPSTPDELMVQYAIINYHRLHGMQTVVVDEDVEYQGVVYKAGTYEERSVVGTFPTLTVTTRWTGRYGIGRGTLWPSGCWDS